MFLNKLTSDKSDFFKIKHLISFLVLYVLKYKILKLPLCTFKEATWLITNKVRFYVLM